MTGLDAALTQLNKRFEAEPEQFREADLRPLARRFGYPVDDWIQALRGRESRQRLVAARQALLSSPAIVCAAAVRDLITGGDEWGVLNLDTILLARDAAPAELAPIIPRLLESDKERERCVAIDAIRLGCPRRCSALLLELAARAALGSKEMKALAALALSTALPLDLRDRLRRLLSARGSDLTSRATNREGEH